MQVLRVITVCTVALSSVGNLKTSRMKNIFFGITDFECNNYTSFSCLDELPEAHTRGAALYFSGAQAFEIYLFHAGL